MCSCWICVWEKVCRCSYTLFCTLIDGSCPCWPTVWGVWSHSKNTRWKTLELSTTKTCKTHGATYTHCRNTKSHTTPTDTLPHFHCLTIYLPAAASLKKRWALLVLWSPQTRPPWRLRVSNSTSLSLIHSAAQAICFLYYQPVSLYYAL